MAGMPSKYQHLKTRLRIEQARLLTWAEKVGLVEELLEQHSRTLSMNRNLIMDVLLEIQAAFKSVVKVTSVYDRIVPEQELIANASTRSQISILRRTLDHLENPSKLIARLEWVMVKQENFEELIVRLIAYNDRIESFLDRSTLEELRVSQERSNLLLLQVADQLGELRALVDAVQLTSRLTSPATLSRSSTLTESDVSNPSPFAELVNFKLQQKTAENTPEGLEMLLSSDLLFPNSVPRAEHRSKSKLYGKSFWVEWSDPVPEIPGIPDLAQIFEGRVAKLASMLNDPKKPTAFRGPKCLGYLRHENDDVGLRFGLVYDASASLGEGSQEADIQSLQNLLQTRRKPSLTKRNIPGPKADGITDVSPRRELVAQRVPFGQHRLLFTDQRWMDGKGTWSSQWFLASSFPGPMSPKKSRSRPRVGLNMTSTATQTY